jgi:hypothetical protein
MGELGGSHWNVGIAAGSLGSVEAEEGGVVDVRWGRGWGDGGVVEAEKIAGASEFPQHRGSSSNLQRQQRQPPSPCLAAQLRAPAISL